MTEDEAVALKKSYNDSVLKPTDLLFQLLEKEHYAAAQEIVPSIKKYLQEFNDLEFSKVSAPAGSTAAG